jgi:hypothetical protein
MELTQLIYSSRPFGYDEATLRAILSQARSNNERDGVTGALICRADLYLQLLEGPKAAVEAAFERISRDDRHAEVTLRFTSPAVKRLFPHWSMLDDPARSWVWSPSEVAEGAVARTSPLRLQSMFRRISNELA